MQRHDSPTVLIVRGAGPVGRRIANVVRDAGGTAVVLDERTCAHDGVHAVRVPLGDVAKPRQSVQDLTVRYGSFEAMVLLPPPAANGGGPLGPTWELDLGHEVSLSAGLVRAAAPALAASSGVVVPVGEPSANGESTRLGTLGARSCLPALRALGDEFGIRLSPIEAEASADVRGAAVASRLIEELDLAAPEGRGAPESAGAPPGDHVESSGR